MELTVKHLRQVLNNLDDDIVLAHLGEGNGQFHTFCNVKRLLLLEDVSQNGNLQNKTYLTINSQGSHFTGEKDQEDLVIKKNTEKPVLPQRERQITEEWFPVI